MEKQKKEQEKTLEENLKDKVWVNFQILKNLEEIKKILMSSHAIQRELYNIVIKEEKEEREGTFKGS